MKSIKASNEENGVVIETSPVLTTKQKPDEESRSLAVKVKASRHLPQQGRVLLNAYAFLRWKLCPVAKWLEKQEMKK